MAGHRVLDAQIQTRNLYLKEHRQHVVKVKSSSNDPKKRVLFSFKTDRAWLVNY